MDSDRIAWPACQTCDRAQGQRRKFGCDVGAGRVFAAENPELHDSRQASALDAAWPHLHTLSMNCNKAVGAGSSALTHSGSSNASGTARLGVLSVRPGRLRSGDARRPRLDDTPPLAAELDTERQGLGAFGVDGAEVGRGVLAASRHDHAQEAVGERGDGPGTSVPATDPDCADTKDFGAFDGFQPGQRPKADDLTGDETRRPVQKSIRPRRILHGSTLGAPSSAVPISRTPVASH
jgi:hypothetical protein